MFFSDREAAGAALAARLLSKAAGVDYVFGIPKGGIPVARKIAEILDRPFDIIINEKIPLPGSPGVGCGAVSELGIYVLNQPLISRLHFSPARIEYLIENAKKEIEHKKHLYHRFRKFPGLDGCQVVLADDGLVTGYSAITAIRSLRKAGCTRVTLALPVATGNSLKKVENEADELIVLNTSQDPFFNLSRCYEDFCTLTDEEVGRMLLVNS